MNWEAIGAIGEWVGAVAVLATLIYLAVQIKQNTRQLKSNSLQNMASRMDGVLTARVDCGLGT
jgi:type III secretory pathway lipoprotein EscJ